MDGDIAVVAEHQPPVRVASGSPGTTFSATSSHLLYNVGDTMNIVDLQKPTSSEPETFTFRELVVSHDVTAFERPLVQSASTIELHSLVALSSGEVLLWKPLHRRESRAVSSAYTPCCKEGAADGAAVTLIRWCPGGEGSFVTAHANGQLLLYDRRRAEDPSVGGAASSRRSMRGVSTALRGGPGGQQQAQRQSPVSSWQVSAAGAAVSALAFSANGRSLAIGMADGVLSLFDFAAETPLMRLHSYFGGVLCCAWSADGRYLLSGGEDDLVAIWSVERRALVARGLGHRSWVQGITSFGPEADERTSSGAAMTAASGDDQGDRRELAGSVHRFASCGADARTLIWEFREADLMGVEDDDVDADEAGDAGDVDEPSFTEPSGSADGRGGAGIKTSGRTSSFSVGAVHAVPFNAVPALPPLWWEMRHLQPMSGVHVCRGLLITACANGIVTLWELPAIQTPSGGATH